MQTMRHVARKRSRREMSLVTVGTQDMQGRGKKVDARHTQTGLGEPHARTSNTTMNPRHKTDVLSPRKKMSAEPTFRNRPQNRQMHHVRRVHPNSLVCQELKSQRRNTVHVNATKSRRLLLQIIFYSFKYLIQKCGWKKVSSTFLFRKYDSYMTGKYVTNTVTFFYYKQNIRISNYFFSKMQFFFKYKLLNIMCLIILSVFFNTGAMPHI